MADNAFYITVPERLDLLVGEDTARHVDTAFEEILVLTI